MSSEEPESAPPPVPYAEVGEVLPPLPVPGTNLTPAQIQGAIAEAAGANRAQIAKIAGVSQSAVKAWRGKTEYRAEVERHRQINAEIVSEAVSAMRSDLVEGVRHAIGELVNALGATTKREGEPNWNVRMRAAELLMQHGIDLHKEDVKARATREAGANAGAAPGGVVALQINVNDGTATTSSG